MTKNDLWDAFPHGGPPGESDYWSQFQSEFGHNFFDEHIERTLEYDRLIGEKIAHKRILEVGGFPGLETAWLLLRGGIVDVIDSPLYVRPYYMDWIYGHRVAVLQHDITNGAPKIPPRTHYDVAIMSDVLMHIDGWPSEFVQWLISVSGEIILINHNKDHGMTRLISNIIPCKEHTLERSFSIPYPDIIIKFMEDNGAKFREGIQILDERVALIFEGKR